MYISSILHVHISFERKKSANLYMYALICPLLNWRGIYKHEISTRKYLAFSCAQIYRQNVDKILAITDSEKINEFSDVCALGRFVCKTVKH